MKVGIIGNTVKENIGQVVQSLILLLNENNIEFHLSNQLEQFISSEKGQMIFCPHEELGKNCDFIISVGGDGTFLYAATSAHLYDIPVVGMNLGKLGFLAEVDINDMKNFIDDIRNGRYIIEERTVLTAESPGMSNEPLIAFNDFVVDKGGWPKMVEISLRVDNEYVTTFWADGLIIATPTGSTGYSLSSGGPIVAPKAEVITLSPISPHGLTFRPIVIPATASIQINVESFHKFILVNSDGQRVMEYSPPLNLLVKKDARSLKILRTSSFSYFKVLRNKLLWGIDVRQIENQKKQDL